MPKTRRTRDDEGVAIVIALLVSLIVFVLVTGVLAEAIHNVAQAGYARRRLAAISAAEAGLNWYANEASSTQLARLKEPFWATETGWHSHDWQQVQSLPEESWFKIKVFYSSWSPCQALDGTGKAVAITCTIDSAANPKFLTSAVPLTDPFPSVVYAVVRSIGVVGDPGSRWSVRRALESFVRLRPVTNGISGALAATSVCLQGGAHVRILGNLSLYNQSDVPSAYPEECSTTNLEVGLKGSTLELEKTGAAEGSLFIRNGGVVVGSTSTFKIQGSLWAEKDVQLGGLSDDPTLSACSTGTGIQCVEKDVIGRSVKFGPKAYVLGDVQEQEVTPPVEFPQIEWNKSFWQATGWSVKDPWTGTVTDLVNAMNAETLKQQTVFHVNSGSCSFDFSSKTITLKYPIAVVSKCGYQFATGDTNVVNATGSTTGRLMLISAWPAATCSSGGQDITLKNNPDFLVPVFLYTPCILWIENGKSTTSEAAISAQFVSRYMIIKNTVKLSQLSLLGLVDVPGGVTGFLQDVKLIRELNWCTASANKATGKACTAPELSMYLGT